MNEQPKSPDFGEHSKRETSIDGFENMVRRRLVEAEFPGYGHKIEHKIRPEDIQLQVWAVMGRLLKETGELTPEFARIKDPQFDEKCREIIQPVFDESGLKTGAKLYVKECAFLILDKEKNRTVGAIDATGVPGFFFEAEVSGLVAHGDASHCWECIIKYAMDEDSNEIGGCDTPAAGRVYLDLIVSRVGSFDKNSTDDSLLEFFEAHEEPMLIRLDIAQRAMKIGLKKDDNLLFSELTQELEDEVIRPHDDFLWLSDKVRYADIDKEATHSLAQFAESYIKKGEGVPGYASLTEVEPNTGLSIRAHNFFVPEKDEDDDDVFLRYSGENMIITGAFEKMHCIEDPDTGQRGILLEVGDVEIQPFESTSDLDLIEHKKVYIPVYAGKETRLYRTKYIPGLSDDNSVQ